MSNVPTLTLLALIINVRVTRLQEFNFYCGSPKVLDDENAVLGLRPDLI